MSNITFRRYLRNEFKEWWKGVSEIAVTMTTTFTLLAITLASSVFFGIYGFVTVILIIIILMSAFYLHIEYQEYKEEVNK